MYYLIGNNFWYGISLLYMDLNRLMIQEILGSICSSLPVCFIRSITFSLLSKKRHLYSPLNHTETIMWMGGSISGGKGVCDVGQITGISVEKNKAMDVLTTYIFSLCSVYTSEFWKLIETPEFSFGDDLFRSVNFPLWDPPYIFWRDLGGNNASKVKFEKLYMKHFSKQVW